MDWRVVRPDESVGECESEHSMEGSLDLGAEEMTVHAFFRDERFAFEAQHSFDRGYPEALSSPQNPQRSSN